jgi:hypothetical protein
MLLRLCRLLSSYNTSPVLASLTATIAATIANIPLL